MEGTQGQNRGPEIAPQAMAIVQVVAEDGWAACGSAEDEKGSDLRCSVRQSSEGLLMDCNGGCEGMRKIRVTV